MQPTTLSRALGTATAVLGLLLALAAPAHADVLSLHAAIQGGGASGEGVDGEARADAFHAGAQGLAYGALVGAEVLFLDGWIEHTQYLRAGTLAGTWTQFMVGLDTQFDVGQATRGRGAERYSVGFGEVGFGAGFGVGTGQQVMPPLDNSQVTDKGFLGQVHIGFGYRFSRQLSAGVRLPVQGAYLFKSGDGLAANDQGNQYVSVQGAVLLELRLSLLVR